MRGITRRTIGRCLIFFLSITVYLSGVGAAPQESFAEGNAAKGSLQTANPALPAQLEPYYYEVINPSERKAGKGHTKIRAAELARKSDDADVQTGGYKGESDVLIWSDPKGWVEYDVEMQEAGNYEMAAEFYPLPLSEGGGHQSVNISVEVNGETPFREAKSISFERMFRDERPFKTDEDGNEFRPQSEELEAWRDEPLRDSGGASIMPLQWPLKQGKNTIRIRLLRQSVALKTITIRPPSESLPNYEQVKAQYPSSSAADGKAIVLEAEQISFKNATSIQTLAYRELLTTPSTYKHLKYNTVGGMNWSDGRQAVGWEIEAPADGLYKLGFRVNQDFRKNLAVFRTVYIDGKIPFSEMAAYRFPYRFGWQGVVLEDKEDNPYLFYLTKGKHTLMLEATIEPFMPILASIERMSDEIRDISLQIRTATGNRVDRYRVWDVEKDIPGLVERLKALRAQLQETVDRMLAINGKTDNVLQSFRSSVKDIDSLLKTPDKIPYNEAKIRSLQQKLDSQTRDLTLTPLQLDKLYLAPEKASFPRMVANFFQKIIGMFVSLFHSFFYQSQFSKQKDEQLNIWMMWGRDYVDQLQQLANEKFTPKYGVKVKINLIQTPDLLVLAKSAGILPDVALGVPSSTPFDMAMRGAALNIAELPGAESVLQNYHPGQLLPYYYDGGYYGLPETLNFKVLFYRKDILDQFKLQVPNTWDDVYKMLPTLVQNNMNFYMDPTDFTYQFFQKSAELYTPDGLRSALDKPEAFDAFKRWTDLYNIYGLEKQVQSFYNQFRRGTLPIGIADFNQFMQLSIAAPEIMNDWGIAPIPGTTQPDGTVARWAGEASQFSTSIMMFKDIPEKKRDLAWQFVQWYTSKEIQTEYGTNLQQFEGDAFLWNSANIHAFVNMSWREEDLKVILEQWRWIKDITGVPGGYMTARELGFGWIRSVIDGENPRVSLEKAVKQINRELARKQQEFQIADENGNALKSLQLPLVNKPWEGVDSFVR